jgi:hypothetical protein
MAGLGHMGFGFAAKPLAPKVNVFVLLAASELPDLLWGIFYFTGIEGKGSDFNFSPWSHSLVMSVFWSLLAALIAARVYHDRRSGIVVGLLVFSHWITDFITHPMGAISGGKPLPPDLPLFFNGSHMVGLGLYNHSFTTAIVTDLALLIGGIAIFLFCKENPIIRIRQKERIH